ncbi:hypothetical protein NUW58_g4067 [Xylaria curta]|uniref:Uncharacterized protein n=1 Tax=Xylaria curta TaxID=42375 RepID=A0ACC1PAS3_9PEZI|nr:hypothetical protein NUW58_g4067 [Xylaria curta]
MYEHPAPRYNFGGVALAGDAAHASGPHLGSGAGFGIEDSLVLASVLEAANAEVRAQPSTEVKARRCRDALITYNLMRFARTQWLPGATREAGELFQWRDKAVGKDHEKFSKRVHELYHTIWDNDIDEMVNVSVAAFKKA